MVGEGGDEHEKSGLREVEISDNTIYGEEFITWVDEDGSFAVASVEELLIFLFGRQVGDSFESANGGGTDGKDTAARFFDLIQCLSCFFGHFVGFGVHLVIFNIGNLDWAKSAEADM